MLLFQQTKGVFVREIGKSIGSDLLELTRLRKIHPEIFGYPNIYHFENKVIHVRNICGQAPKDICCIDETKLDCSYRSSKFHKDGYQFTPFRRKQNKIGGGKLPILKKDSL